MESDSDLPRITWPHGDQTLNIPAKPCKCNIGVGLSEIFMWLTALTAYGHDRGPIIYKTSILWKYPCSRCITQHAITAQHMGLSSFVLFDSYRHAPRVEKHLDSCGQCLDLVHAGDGDSERLDSSGDKILHFSQVDI